MLSCPKCGGELQKEVSIEDTLGPDYRLDQYERDYLECKSCQEDFLPVILEDGIELLNF